MDFIEKYLQSKILLWIIIVVLCLTNVFSVCYFKKHTDKKEECICEECPLAEVEGETKEETSKIKVDIKGYVKKPGVYEIDAKSIVNDQTCPIMIQRLNNIFQRNPLISMGI